MKTQPVKKSSFSPQTGKLTTGTVVGKRYRIDHVLGVGGMGTVYVARDLRFSSMERLCAVKEMLALHRDAEFLAQIQDSFDREANILASLSHPAIPKVYDYFHEDDHYFLVLELIDGKDLETILDEAAKPLAVDQVVEWAIQTCEVLTYLHGHKPKPIIFRDMKPSNIMLCSDGRIMLVDFGIAKQLQPAVRGTMIGTEGYAPPEQYKGVADPRVDIYALGATMHHLLTNQDPRLEPPFSFHQRPVTAANPDVPPELSAIIEQSLAYEPHIRFRSAALLREALVEFQKGTKSTPRVAGAATKSLDPYARFVQPAQTKPAPPRGQPVSVPAFAPVPAQPSAITPLWTFACEEEVRSTPTVSAGTLYIGCYDNNLYALDAQTGKFRWKYATEGGIAATPCVEEDLVIVGSEDRIIYAVYAKTGQIAWTFPTKGCIRSSPRALGGHVFFGSDDHTIYALNARKGHLRWSFDTHKPVRSSAGFLEHFVIMGGEDGFLYALDFSTGKVQWKVRPGGPIVSSVAIGEKMLYVGSMDWMIYALDSRSGWPVWQYRTGDRIISSPALSGERVYIGSVDGSLYCIDARWGKLVWRTELGGQVTSSPAVVNDQVYVGSTNGSVFCLDSKNGKIVWSFATQGPIPSSPAVVDGVVYIGSIDHHVYALPA